MSKLKLAIVTRNFSKIGGGAENLAVTLATAMLGECEITVISQGFDQPPELFTHIPVPKLPIRTRWLNQLWFSWLTRRLVRQGFDVVHSYENITHGDVQTVSVKTVHASLKQRGMSALRIKSSPRLLAYLWLEKKRLCTPQHHNVFVSQFVHDETQAIMPSLSASSVIPPGVQIPDRAASPEERSAARTALGLRPHTMTIGFVGHDFKKKGLDALLKAVGQLPFAVQVAVFGNPSKAHQYSEQIALLRDDKSCHFMGVVSNMSQAYTAMDCLAHPTTQDVFPMVLLEAMAHQVPVITTSAPFNNMGGLLDHQKNAILMSSPQDIEGLAEGLRSLWQSADLRPTLAHHGLEFAQQYSWEVAKQKHYAIYRQFSPKLPL
jgi:UDP-glucose:(heptosyl)LPS alpha-1,3-glucosyltransferase